MTLGIEADTFIVNVTLGLGGTGSTSGSGLISSPTLQYDSTVSIHIYQLMSAPKIIIADTNLELDKWVGL